MSGQILVFFLNGDIMVGGGGGGGGGAISFQISRASYF